MGRILVIRGGAVGDFILTLPAIELLRTQLDNPHLEILGYPAIAALAVEFGFADATRSIERGPVAGFFVPEGDLDREWQCYFSDFDLIVSYLYDPDGFFHDNLKRAGVKSVIQASHRVDESLDLPAAAQLAKPLEEIALFPERNYVTFELEPSAGTSTIAIHPGSGSPRKNWGYENWCRVATALHQQHPDSRFLVISGEAESESIADFLQLMTAAGVPFEHLQNAPLPEVARRLGHCTRFLGHDSGISHLAAACDIPVTLIFGPTRSQIWAPQNPQVRIIEAPEGRMDLVTVEMLTTAAS
tara:strand:+ start:589 stop:1488 length:900 start_codon:yes stop_codon:yes gene_type:complete